MNLLSKMKKPSGKIIMSILLGFGLATLFRSVCNDESCTEYVAVQPKEIKNKIIKNNGRCYTYNMETTQCNTNKGKMLIKFE
jgi:hypothetical protein